MGKVRVNVIGGEAEEQQKVEAQKRREAKKAEKEAAKAVEEPKEAKTETVVAAEQPKKEKKMVKKQTKEKTRSPRYVASRKAVEKGKVYALPQALDLLSQMQKTKFDETVELHINTNDKVTGSIVLPHGNGKKTKVAILAPTKDPKAAEELLKEIESGKINFDVLVATPDAMPKLAKVARILGPRGLMPNPKTGTVTPRPEEVAKKYEGGQLNYKTEAKANVMHVAVGKASFGKEKLTENISAFLDAMDNSKVKTVFLKSTMSPSLKLK